MGAMSSRKPRVPQAERRRGAMGLILECAETEFAQNGYDGATFASVAARAGVDTSLVRYYFGDKEKLFAAVFKRRAPASNALRQRRMAAYRAKAGPDMTLEGIIDAFTRPSFELANSDPGWRNYCKIVSYVNSASGEFHDLMSECFDTVSRELIADLRAVLPTARNEDLYWSYHFLTGAYTFSLGQTERIDTISGGAVSSHDFASISRRLPMVLGAGIRAICSAGEAIEQRPFNPLPAGAIQVAVDATQHST